jgi:hypothetical protein
VIKDRFPVITRFDDGSWITMILDVESGTTRMSDERGMCRVTTIAAGDGTKIIKCFDDG